MRGRYERNPGRTVELNVGGSQDVLDLQWRDEIAHVLCVTLIGPPATSAGQVNAAACVAFVQWGAGEAEAALEQTLSRFTEGFETGDLQDARQLLHRQRKKIF